MKKIILFMAILISNATALGGFYTFDKAKKNSEKFNQGSRERRKVRKQEKNKRLKEKKEKNEGFYEN